MCTHTKSFQRRRRGLTLLDSMFLTAIIGVLAVGVGRSLQALASVSEGNDEQRAISEEVLSELEVARTNTFTQLAALTSPGTVSDTVSITVGTVTRSYPRVTKIAYIDPTNPTTGTNPQTDFISIQITIGQCTSAVWVTAL